jgi:hypothetical protein
VRLSKIGCSVSSSGYFGNHFFCVQAQMEGDLTKNAAFMDLYSRQIGAFGIETMGKLINMRVIIVGIKGVGVEVAKNLILAGPGSVILCDNEVTEVISCFYCV